MSYNKNFIKNILQIYSNAPNHVSRSVQCAKWIDRNRNNTDYLNSFNLPYVTSHRIREMYILSGLLHNIGDLLEGKGDSSQKGAAYLKEQNASSWIWAPIMFLPQTGLYLSSQSPKYRYLYSTSPCEVGGKEFFEQRLVFVPSVLLRLAYDNIDYSRKVYKKDYRTFEYLLRTCYDNLYRQK